MFVIVHSGALIGIEALPVHIEMKSGLHGDPGLRVVGLPDAAVKESTERVTAAMMNGGFSLSDTRTVINLAPGDIRRKVRFMICRLRFRFWRRRSKWIFPVWKILSLRAN